MQAVDKETAKFFFGSFMFLVTNLLLWMFLAIIFDYYRCVDERARPCVE